MKAWKTTIRRLDRERKRLAKARRRRRGSSNSGSLHALTIDRVFLAGQYAPRPLVPGTAARRITRAAKTG